MIHLKGITTAGAYDNQGKYLEEIHEDIEKNNEAANSSI